ncbi:LysR family transcriptional regulator [Staphylococcus succinus]|nr:LysR family transcriptional regulator [Staphylococcus succinus]
MELRHLKYFKTVAEELHFGKAAKRLNMAQPPLSLQIRQLEEALGVPLFRRTKRSVTLTQEGHVFLEKVYQLFENLNESIETVRLVNRGKIGEIVIGFLASAAYDVLPSIIKSYRYHYPSIHVTLKQLTTAEQLKALQDETIDIGIISEPIESTLFNYEIIRQEPMVVALPSDHSLTRVQRPIMLSDLACESFILTGREENQLHYDKVINSCGAAGFSPHILQETKEMSTLISLVSAGIGIAIVPSSIQSLLQNEVVYREISDSNIKTVTALVWDSKNDSPTVNAFVELVKSSVIPMFQSNHN